MKEIENLELKIIKVFREERFEREMQDAEREAQKAQNMIDFAG